MKGDIKPKTFRLRAESDGEGALRGEHVTKLDFSIVLVESEEVRREGAKAENVKENHEKLSQLYFQRGEKNAMIRVKNDLGWAAGGSGDQKPGETSRKKKFPPHRTDKRGNLGRMERHPRASVRRR